MKKSLIALAVLAASGAAMAQSTVTIYGLADVWFGNVKTEGAGDSMSTTKLNSGGVSGSRWGIKGSEDLGGGLKANFLLEQGISLDSGAGGSTGFSRQSYVGFSGGFGEVKLGKVWTAYDDVSGASNAVFDSGALAPMNYVFASTDYLANPGNTVYYSTPTFGGFAGAVSYALAEDPRDGVTVSTSVSSFNVTYGAGPVAVQLGYQLEDNHTAANDKKITRLGGSYDFGVAVAKATYGKVANVGNVSGDDVSEYQFGVDVPLSSALTVSASYAKSDDDKSSGAFEASRKGYGIAASYALSKRTFVYTGYTSVKETVSAAADEKTKAFAVGVQHKF